MPCVIVGIRCVVARCPWLDGRMLLMWGQATGGRRRLGYAAGLMSSILTGPCHIPQRTSKITRKLAKCSLGGEVHALSDMVDHMSLQGDLYGPFEGPNAGMAESEDCESLFT